MLAFACVCSFAQAEKQQKPSMAFLEFLAELQKVDGEYVSPMSLTEQENTADKQASKDKQPQDKAPQPEANKKPAEQLTDTEVKQ